MIKLAVRIEQQKRVRINLRDRQTVSPDESVEAVKCTREMANREEGTRKEGLCGLSPLPTLQTPPPPRPILGLIGQQKHKQLQFHGTICQDYCSNKSNHRRQQLQHQQIVHCIHFNCLSRLPTTCTLASVSEIVR